MTDVTDVVMESVLPVAVLSRAGSPVSVVASGLAAGTWFRCPGAAGLAVFCGDACSRRFHNAARSPGGDGGAVSPGQAADPLGALEALIRQAGSVVTLARGQVAALDPEVVAAQLAEAEAARRRAEARAVTAEARAAEAEEDMLAALEAAEAAHRGREAAEAEARRARRGDRPGPPRAGRGGRRPALTQKPPRAVRTGWPPRPPGSPRPHGRNAIRLVSEPRRRFVLPRLSWPGPGGASPAPREQAREDAAREREALAGQYQARLQAAEQLAAAERDRALRAEQRLDAERERHDGLLAVLTGADGEDGRPAGPAARRARARGTAGTTS